MKARWTITMAAVTLLAGLLGPVAWRMESPPRQAEPIPPADITGRVDPQARIEAAGEVPAVTVEPVPQVPLVTGQAAAEDPAAAEAALVRTAIALFRRGDIAGGDAEAAQARDEATRKLLGWAAIRIAPRQVGFDRIQAFLSGNPDWPQQGWLRRRAEEALVAERRSDSDVLAFFASAQPVTAGGRLALARVLAAQGRQAEAAALVTASWRTDTFGPESEERYLAAFPDTLNAADHRRRAMLFALGEDWSGAQRNAARAGSDVQALVKAISAVARGAGDAKKLVDGLPTQARQEPVLLLFQAETLRKQKKGVEAARLLAPVPREADSVVDPEPWWTERRALVRNLLDADQPRLAYEVAARYPLGSPGVAVDAEFHAGWIALRFLKEPARASRHFDEAAKLATTPISMARAAYWQGRSAEAAAAPSTAFYEHAAAYPTTFYGQLAKARIDARDYAVRKVLKAGPLSLDRLPAVRAIATLYESGSPDLVLPLASDLAQTLDSPDDLDALAEGIAARGDARTLLAVGKTALQRGMPVDNHAFPLLGVPEVTTPGGAERSLVMAIARQESAFDARVVSSAGARGLMQLMPATAKATADKAGLAYDEDRLTGDAAYNATLGSAHLGDLVEAWKGSYLLTVASYNAGAGNVKKWIAAYGDPRRPDVDPVDWVERIPFNETRNYVQRVMENLQVYRSRLGIQSVILLDRDLRRGGAPDEQAGR